MTVWLISKHPGKSTDLEGTGVACELSVARKKQPVRERRREKEGSESKVRDPSCVSRFRKAALCIYYGGILTFRVSRGKRILGILSRGSLYVLSCSKTEPDAGKRFLAKKDTLL